MTRWATFNTRAQLDPLVVLARLEASPGVEREPCFEAAPLRDVAPGPIVSAFLAALQGIDPEARAGGALFVRRRVKFSHWHTDYARSRPPARNYLLITGAPRTWFLRERGIALPGQPPRLASYVDGLARAGHLTPYELEPWHVIGYDGNELHRGDASVDARARLFVRVTFPPPRR